MIPHVNQTAGYKNMFRVFITAIVCHLASVAVAQQLDNPESKPYAFSDEDGRSNPFAEASLTARGSAVLEKTTDLLLTLRFKAKKTVLIANPWGNPLLPIPYQVMVYDENKKWLGDVNSIRIGSQRSELITDVVSVPPNGVIESEIRLSRIAFKILAGGKDPSGRYYIQIIYNRDFQRTMRGLLADRPYFSGSSRNIGGRIRQEF